jgi:hypothetical protein
MFLPISSNSGLTFERGFAAADHDRQRGGLAPTSPPETGASRYSQPSALMRCGEFLGGDRRDRAHVDHDLAGGQGLRPMPLASEQHRADVRRVGHHGEDDVGLLRHFTALAHTLAPFSMSSGGHAAMRDCAKSS